MPDDATTPPPPEPDPDEIPGTHEPDDRTPGDPDLTDAKEKFRQALERKKQSGPDSVGDPRHGESVHGRTDTHKHGGKREFRRKAGP